MMTIDWQSARRGAARTAARGATMTAIALCTVAATACNLDKALKVQDVDVATPESVITKAGLPVLYAGGRADFQVQFTGTDASVTFPGLLTDELRDIDTFPTRIEVDQRATQRTNGTLTTWYRNMHLARVSLERATAAFHQFDPTNVQLAELHALDGFMYTFFAEDFCNGVAYSTFGTPPVYGSANTGTQSLDRAIAQFDTAISLAKPLSQELYLAKVGRGRALLNLGRFADAAAAVTGVPVDFQYLVYASENSNRENNGIYVNVGPPSKRFAVADVDATNGLPFRTLGMDTVVKTGDPRVRWYKLGIGQDGASPAYYTVKYPSRSAPTVLADGIEAQLIIAENEFKTGAATAAMTRLNDLRANTTLLNRVPYTNAGQSAATALPALADPGTTAGRVDLLFQERAFWMYLTGHRLGDLRRLVRQYGRTAESVFPTGTYKGAAGGAMGTDVNFPIPIDEQNNDVAPSCTDRLP